MSDDAKKPTGIETFQAAQLGGNIIRLADDQKQQRPDDLHDDEDPAADALDDEKVSRLPPKTSKPRGTQRRPAHFDLDDGPLLNTDVANARRVHALYSDRIHFTEALGYLVYDARRWAEDPKDVRVQGLVKERLEAVYDEVRRARDREAMAKHAAYSQSARAIGNAIKLLRSETGILADVTTFDANPMLLNVANGTLDLTTGKLRAYDPADRITRIVPITYTATATCALWTAFLWRVTAGNDELIAYLHKLVGYCLTGLTVEQVLHFLYGVGANGKSVFCEILAALLGEYAMIASPEMVMAKRHGGIPNDIARLRSVRIALMNETTQGARFDEAKLKDLTGGDKLTGRFLHREFFDFHPTHKLLIRGNHKPQIAGTDEGIWRRLRLLPFTVEIPLDEQDPHLVSKLKGELPGILAWAVQGCLLWQRDGLKPPACVLEAVQEYRADSDVLGRFIAECCEVRPLAQVKSQYFQTRFREFAEAAGEHAIPAKDLKHEMHRRGFKSDRKKSGVIFEGIALQVDSQDFVV